MSISKRRKKTVREPNIIVIYFEITQPIASKYFFMPKNGPETTIAFSENVKINWLENRLYFVAALAYPPFSALHIHNDISTKLFC